MEEYHLITSNMVLDLILIAFGLPMLFFVLACIIGGTINTVDCIIKSRKENVSISEAKKMKKEEAKEQEEWYEKVRKMKRACREIAEIRELPMHFQTVHDSIVGEMEICYQIDDMPTYLHAFKCTMDRRYFDHRKEDESHMVIFFAENIQDVIDYLNCYSILYEGTSGFCFSGREYLYDDAYIPLQPCDDLPSNIRHAQAAFVIYRCTGLKWLRENNRARYHSVA